MRLFPIYLTATAAQVADRIDAFIARKGFSSVLPAPKENRTQ